MVDWAYVRWWVSLVTSKLLGGVSPAKDWLKHLVPVLWPKDKAKVNLEPEAELRALRTDLIQETQGLLTVAHDLISQAEKRDASSVGWEARLNKQADYLTKLEARLDLWEKDLRAREDALRRVEEGCSALEGTLRGLFYDIRGVLRPPKDGR
ncbi:hypothetical protein BDV30DRAFT_234927 [Aspergillus minisclerotigenes]|uniref:Uncharacterized protein n=1 Tax=Aspergillus minisclerotigenes TaxID=656917 RepID=A0A5N6JE31_9EURO|nr:hypothetical protein BDV30DRAFT_234927 [Aspergillus minisclerotigenes]